MYFLLLSIHLSRTTYLGKWVDTDNKLCWRRKRDSNSRSGFPDAAFRERCFRPLSHSSMFGYSTIFGVVFNSWYTGPMNLQNIDLHIIRFFQKYWIQFARFAVATLFIWFGLLKAFGLSPAGPLVHALFESSIHFVSFTSFYIFFAWFEIAIGILFLIPQMTRVVMPLLLIHMITTFGPLVLLPQESWSGFLVPTLVGQYIIKNLVIIAVAMGVSAQLHPIQKD